jgi:hypothetical protein
MIAALLCTAKFSSTGLNQLCLEEKALRARTTDTLQERWDQRGQALLVIRRRIDFAGWC